MRGAIREDDLGDILGINSGDDPHDDPYGPFQRVYNHFFDPIKNRKLTLGDVYPLGDDTNPNWAIGTTNAFATPIAENTNRRNHFSVHDAREAMYRALTGQAKDGTRLGINGTTANEAMRKTYWATLFRSLGDVLHLNQDMAQPQHTRNEAHSGIGGLWSNGVTGHSSFYELYTEARAVGATEFFMEDEGIKAIKLTPLVFDGYAIPAFNKFSDFWSTGIGSASLTGTGLADYSNHSFFTPAKNFGHPEFQSPPSDLSRYTVIPSPYLLPDGTQVAKKYLVGKDNLPPIRMSRQGIWGSDPSPVASIAYTMDRNVYDDMASLLIPRAVAYSAGIINYFFRGKMEISLPDTGVYGLIDHAKFAPGGPNYPTDPVAGTKGFDKIKLKLKNTTDPINTTPQSMTQGTLVAILKFHRNTCYKDDLSGELNNQSPLAAQVAACRSENEDIAVSDPLPPRAVPAADTAPDGVELTFTFSGKQMPMNAWDVSLQVVYRGKLGSEDDAVAVATKDISEPTHVVFFSPFGWESKWSVLNLEPPVYPGYSAKFKLSFGPSQTPVTIQPPTEKSNLLVSPYFSRFAMLQDLAKPVEFTVACNCFSNSPFVEFLRPYVAQQGKPYEAMESTAGIAWWGINLPYTVTRAYIGGTPPAAPNADDVKHVPALPDWARYPVPVEISGW